MKIAIISDTHDNAPNLEKALAWMNNNGIEQIIHCGDMCAPAFLREVLAAQFSGSIHVVFGNVEDRVNMPQVVEKLNNVTHYGDVAEFTVDSKRIAVNHYPEKAKELAQTGKYNYSFYGHTHKPWDEMVGACRVLNPGTLAGLFQKATFAVWDTTSGEFELKVLELL